MNYVWYYSATTFLFLCVTAFFYLRQRRISNLHDRLYIALLFCAIVASFLDTFAAAVEPNANALPYWFICAINAVFLFALHVCLPLTLFYTIALTGRFISMPVWLRVLALLPNAFITAMIAISPFTRLGIFYIDQDNIYRFGATHSALYLVAAGYLVAGCVEVYLGRKNLALSKYLPVLTFSGLIIVAIVVQLWLPRYLLTCTATGLALTVMYHALQSPSEHIDPVTELFNRSALHELLSGCFENDRRLTLLVISAANFDMIERTLGARMHENLLRAFTAVLQRVFRRKLLLRISASHFAVIFPGVLLGEDRCRELIGRFPDSLLIGETPAKIAVAVKVIDSERFPDADHMVEVVDYLLSQKTIADNGITVLDEVLREQINAELSQQLALEKAISEDAISLRFLPIFSETGKVCALEAYPAVPCEQLAELSPAQLYQLAAQTGNIMKIARPVFVQSCAFIAANDMDALGISHICVKLSTELCMRVDLSEAIFAIAQAQGADPARICFCITESNETRVLPAILANLRALAGMGFRYSLDSFGAGYNDLGYISEFPLIYVRLSGQIVRGALQSDSKRALLSAILTMIRDLGLNPVCDGVDSVELEQMLNGMGRQMRQGTLYCEPLEVGAIAGYLGSL